MISTLNIKVGETAGGQPVAVLVDTNDLVVDITVDEIDVAKIMPGQEVVLTLDALPGVEIKGTSNASRRPPRRSTAWCPTKCACRSTRPTSRCARA